MFRGPNHYTGGQTMEILVEVNFSSPLVILVMIKAQGLPGIEILDHNARFVGKWVIMLINAIITLI